MATSPAVILEQAGVRITRLDELRTRVRVQRKLIGLVLYPLLLLVFSPFVILLPMAFFTSAKVGDDWLVLLCVGCVVLVFWACTLGIVSLSAFGLYVGLFPRRLLIDHQLQACEFLGAPGLGLTFRLPEVQAVTLSARTDGLWRLGWLGISLVGESRLLLVQGIARPALFYASATAQLEPVAQALADLLHTKFECRDDVTAFTFQWR